MEIESYGVFVCVCVFGRRGLVPFTQHKNFEIYQDCFKDQKFVQSNSWVIRWLGILTSTAGGPASIPGGRNKIQEAVQYGKNKQTNKNPTKTSNMNQQIVP